MRLACDPSAVEVKLFNRLHIHEIFLDRIQEYLLIVIVIDVKFAKVVIALCATTSLWFMVAFSIFEHRGEELCFEGECGDWQS